MFGLALKNIKKWTLLFIIVTVFFSVTTLTISPLPWFDETFMANISWNLTKYGVFQLDICNVENPTGNTAYLYGPIFFFISSMVFKIFGFGIFQYRVVPLLFSILCILVCTKFIKERPLKYLFFLLLFTDPLFYTNSHSGRMDSTALFFVLLSIYFCFCHQKKTSINILYSGIFGTLAFLTTPRIGFLLIPISVVFVYRLIESKTPISQIVKQLIIWSSPFVVGVSAWIGWAFGSLNNYINFYTNISGEYVGALSFPKFYQYPLIIFSFAILVQKILKKSNFSHIDYISISSIILFYVVVKDSGTYSVLILPFYYLFIIRNVGILNFVFQKFDVVILLFLATLNLSILGIKSATIITAYNLRNPVPINTFIRENIPPNANVIGDEMYFYSCQLNNNDFQYIHLYQTLEERESFQREKFKYEYIVWSDRLESLYPNVLNYYLKNSNCKPIAHFETKINSVNTFFLKYIPVRIISNYNCTIYKRIIQ